MTGELINIVTETFIDDVCVNRNGRRAVDAGKVAELARSVAEIGLLQPITIRDDGTLIAGLHRLEAFRLLGRDSIPAIIVTLDDLDAELAEIDENLVRNELTALERADALARRKVIYETKHPETKRGGDRKSATAKSKRNDFALILPFADDTAARTGVSPRTVQQEVQIATNLAEDVKEILRGTPVGDSKTDLLKLARMEPQQQREVAEKIARGEARNVKGAKRAIQREKKAAVPDDLPARSDRYRLIHGDFVEVARSLEPGSIDVIVTDPPYSREYLGLYEVLAGQAARLLKPGGSLLAMAGQSYLPEVFALMTPHVTYHWVVAYLTPGGQSPQIWARKVNTFWKPVLWFTNGEYAGPWVGDVARSAVNDKRFHYWGQSESGMADLVERFSVQGDLILDPFCGGGTTGVVALALNRRFVGVDVDERAIEKTRRRLEHGHK